jgi:hypothetical protein
VLSLAEVALGRPACGLARPNQTARVPPAQMKTAPSGLAMNRPIAVRTFIVPPWSFRF